MRILVCGGRDFTDAVAIAAVMHDYDTTIGEKPTLIHGCARGADSLAASIARDWNWNVMAFPAQWEKYGKGAGPMRNKLMLLKGRPHVVIAFPGGKGTADMVRQATKAGVTVREGKP